MKRDAKATAVAELTEKFGRARLAIVTESAGLPVNQVTELRKQLRGAKAEYKVMKNTLAIRASEGTTLAGLKTHLKGPTGVVIGYDDPVLPTKILKDFIGAEKREEKIRIMLGVLEGKILQPAELAAVAKLPKKEVLIAMLLSAMQGPIRGVVYTLNAVLTKFVRVIAAIQDKRKGEGDMSATATKHERAGFGRVGKRFRVSVRRHGCRSGCRRCGACRRGSRCRSGRRKNRI